MTTTDTITHGGLTFFPKSHRYKLDGRWVEGVTTLIKGALPPPGLPYWAARTEAEYVADNRDQVEHLWDMGRGPMVAALKEIPFQRRDEAAVKGTDIHWFAEQIVTGVPVDVPEPFVPYVESCVGFLDEWAIKPILIETPVASREHQYAGTLDLVAESRHAPPGIFDYTTGSGVYENKSFQNAAYAFAEFVGTGGGEYPLPNIGASLGVHIRADGWDVHPLEFGAHVFDEFVALARVTRIAKRARGDRKTPGYVKPAWQLEDR